MSFLEARQALDKSLASPAWTDRDAVAAAVRRHLATACEEQNVSTTLGASGNILGNSNKENILPESKDGVDTETTKPARCARFSEKVVEARTKELLGVLDSLRSAGEADVESLALNAESIREDGVDSGNDRQWRLKEEGREHRVLYRKGPEGTPLHEICLEGIINGPLDTLLAVVWEVPFFKDWWPQFSVPPFKVLESKFATRIAPGLELTYLHFKSPWPFSSRELLFIAFMVQDTATGLFVATVLSPPEDPSHLDPETSVLDAASVPPIGPGLVRMTVDGGFAGQDLGGGRSYFRGACMLDLKLDLMPPWLINFVARQLAGSGYHLLCHEVEAIVKASGTNEQDRVNHDKTKGRGKFQQLLASDPIYVGLREAMVEYTRGKAEEEERRMREGSVEEVRSMRRLGEKVEEEVERLVSSLSKRENVLGPEEAEAALLQLEAAAASAVALTKPVLQPAVAVASLGSHVRDRVGSRRGMGGAAGMADSEASAAAATIVAAVSAAHAPSSGPLPLARHGGPGAGDGMASLLRESSSVRSGPLPSIRTITGSTSSGINNIRAGGIPDMLNNSCSVTSSRSSFSCGGSGSSSSSLSSSGNSSPSSYPGLYHRDPAIFRAVATLDKAILFVRARAAAGAAETAAAAVTDAQGTGKHEKSVVKTTAGTRKERAVFVLLSEPHASKSQDGPEMAVDSSDVIPEIASGCDKVASAEYVENASTNKVDGRMNERGKRIFLPRIGKRFLWLRFSHTRKTVQVE
ncbi:hypothetical protein CLOM_g20310 [Closterium sp. NIES-68]|nr:hypothetical protein CLOM_g20310 [Closterium sp. NIES-68]GJP61743.1 hypothetical protein CLOP_g18880 [Closterium sp. NIES-67]